MRISVMVGSRCSDWKYFWQKAMSASSMARPFSFTKLARPSSSSAQKPVRVSTVLGVGYSICRVSLRERLASRASTGLMTYFLI